MTEFWSSWWAFAFILAPFITSLSGLAIVAYTAHYDLEKMKAVFPSSLYIANTIRRSAGFSFTSRVMQVCTIAGAVIWPTSLIRLGELDPDELRNFPACLKRRLTISVALIFTGMAWLFLAVGLIKLNKD
ncbi:hypothetical protein D3C85_745570 [compost metagenome]